MRRSVWGQMLRLLPALALVPACAAPGLTARPEPLGPMRFAPAEPPPASPPEVRRQRLLEAVPELREHLRAWLEAGRSPGLAAAVVTPEGRLWSLGLGEANSTTGEAVTGRTLFRIGSITKTFTGALLLALAERGLLGLDDPVERWVPEFGGVLYPTRDSPRVTLRHLVTHTSGLPRVGRLDYTDPGREVSEADLVAALRDQRLEFAPGARVQYSNLAMAVAGLALARAGGRPLRELLAELVLEPLEMGRTTFDPAGLEDPGAAQGHALRKEAFEPGEPWRLGAAEAAGGLWSSLEDMTRYAAFQLAAWPPRDDPEQGPLRRARVRESHTPWGPLMAGQPRFGVNWAVGLHPAQGAVVSHAGGTYLFAASVRLLPERGLGVVLLANCGGRAGELAEGLTALAGELLDSLLRHSPEPSVALSSPFLAALERVRTLLEAPEAIPDQTLEELFHPDFRRAVPDEELRRMLQTVHAKAGACREALPLRSLGAHAAALRLDCERGQVELVLHVETEPPHRVIGLGFSAP